MQLLACVSEAAGLGQDGSQGYRCAETNDLLWAARNLTTQGPDPQPDGGETVMRTARYLPVTLKHPPTYIYTPPSLAPPVLERSGPPLRSVALRSELDPPLARSLLGGQISSQHLFPCFFQPEMAKCSKKRLDSHASECHFFPPAAQNQKK